MTRIAVIGVGLMGGSIGLAARQRELAEVVGWVRDPKKGQECLDLGAVDRMADSLADAVGEADLVFCCVSVGAMPAVVAEVLDAVGEDTVVTDVGSTKGELVRRFGDDPRFIGGHPLAGAETAGVEAASPDLYEEARWFLTPTESTSGVLYDRLQRFLLDIGARPAAIDPIEHDRAMAVVSHLPHVFANQLAGQGRAGSERLGAVAPSLRDATRVAGSNPAIWGEILATNHEAVVAAIDEAIGGLREAREVISSADSGEIQSWQARAADTRAALSAIETPAGTTREIRIAVPNRPGVLARIALALGEAGVNIEDMSLEPAPDMSSGAISVWVAGDEDVARAVACVEGLGHSVTVSPGR